MDARFPPYPPKKADNMTNPSKAPAKKTFLNQVYYHGPNVKLALDIGVRGALIIALLAAAAHLVIK